MYILKSFEKVKTLKFPAGSDIMTYRSVVNSPNHCASLFDNNFVKETIFKTILDFTVFQ